MTGERWRRIEGCPNYSVSDAGRVRSEAGSITVRTRWGGTATRHVSERVLSPTINGDGYLVVSVGRGRRRTQRKVHQLVLEAFVGERGAGEVTRHLNGRRTDNRLENLAWGTHAENNEDRVRHGTIPRGERHRSSKLTADSVRAIRRAYLGAATLTDLAIEYGVHLSTIGRIVRYETWAHI